MCLLCRAALRPSRAPLSLIAFARQIEASHAPGSDNGAPRDVRPRLSAHRSAQVGAYEYPLSLVCNAAPPAEDDSRRTVDGRHGDGSRQNNGGDYGPGSSSRQARLPPPDCHDDAQRSFHCQPSSNSGTRASSGGAPNPGNYYYYDRNAPNAEGDSPAGHGDYRAPQTGGDYRPHTAAYGDHQQTALPDYSIRQPHQDPMNAPAQEPGRCQCGQGQPTLALPDRPLEPRWCPRCPSRPRGAVVASPPDVNPAHERTRAPKRCRCGKSAHPKHGLDGEPPQLARWCSQCPSRPNDAMDIVSKRCECGQGLPIFGIMVDGADSRKVARYWCASCPNRPPQARDMSKKCECRRSKPSFGLPGEEKKAARWCSRCPTKPAEAVDVVNKRCECGLSLPSFGLPGEGRKNARWCSRCPEKPPQAVNVINKRCVCGTSKPSLGLPGEPAKFARWCSQCPTKPIEAIDVINKRCECGARRPGFGLPGEPAKDARWCKTCPSKPESAINIRAANSSQQNK